MVWSVREHAGNGCERGPEGRSAEPDREPDRS